MLKIILAICVILLIILIFLNIAKLNIAYRKRKFQNIKYTKKIRREKLDNIKNKIKPFDLILFKANDILARFGTFIWKHILGNGEWTHVGMVVTTDVIPIKNGVPNHLYILESTISGKFNDNVYNIETNKSTLGMQVRDLEEIFKFYIDDDIREIAWCRLKNNPININFNETKEKFQEFYVTNYNATHSFNVFPLIRSLISDIYHNYIENLNIMNKRNFFCSELVVTIYIKLGIIPPDVNPASIAPIDLVGYVNNTFKLFDSPIYLI